MPKPTSPPVTTDETRFLSGPQVAERYGINVKMTLWRWLNDPAYSDLGFPQPAFMVRERRFWRESDLVAWERRRAAQVLQRKPAPRTKQHAAD
jgi:predicted DNA-binding transcriptional regulator AlpA